MSRIPRGLSRCWKVRAHDDAGRRNLLIFATRPAAARSQIKDWLSAPPAWVPQETDAHREIFSRLVEDHQATGNLVSDVHLAALAISHGLDLYSADSDLARFPEMTWIHPLN